MQIKFSDGTKFSRDPNGTWISFNWAYQGMHGCAMNKVVPEDIAKTLEEKFKKYFPQQYEREIRGLEVIKSDVKISISKEKNEISDKIKKEHWFVSIGIGKFAGKPIIKIYCLKDQQEVAKEKLISLNINNPWEVLVSSKPTAFFLEDLDVEF